MNEYPYPSHRNNEMMLGFLFGAIVGAGVALLMAPASGEETRRRLGDTAKGLGRDARTKFDELKETAKHKFEEAREHLPNAVNEVKSTVEGARDSFMRARQGQETVR